MNRPYRLTPMHEWHQRHGAHMVEVSGWMRVVDYGNPGAEVTALQSSVGLCDATPLTKIDVRGKHSARLLEDRWRIPEVGRCLPLANARADGGPAYLARLTCERFIMLGSSEEGPQLYKRLTDAAADSGTCAHVTDVTSAYAVLQLMGPMSTKLLKKLSSVRVDSMTIGCCLEGPLAGVRVLLIRRDLSNFPSWLLLVSRDFGEYAWECVFSAGHEFGIRPFGTAAERTFASEKVTDVSVV